MDTMDRAAAKLLNKAVEDALRPVAERMGLKVEVSGGTYDTTGSFKPRVVFTTPQHDAEQFNRQASYLQLPLLFHFGGQFVFNGATYTLHSWRPRAFKSLIAVHQGNGKRYAFTIAVVKAAMGLL